MKMRLGFTIKPDISVERIVGLTRSAETAGFEYGWMFDSHIAMLPKSALALSDRYAAYDAYLSKKDQDKLLDDSCRRSSYLGSWRELDLSMPNASPPTIHT